MANGENPSSSISQRIRALEEAGIIDTFVKKRIPPYLGAGSTSDAFQTSGQHTNFVSGTLTKIYQNPVFAESGYSAVGAIFQPINRTSHQRNGSSGDLVKASYESQVYRSPSVDSIEEGSVHRKSSIESLSSLGTLKKVPSIASLSREEDTNVPSPYDSPARNSPFLPQPFLPNDFIRSPDILRDNSPQNLHIPISIPLRSQPEELPDDRLASPYSPASLDSRRTSTANSQMDSSRNRTVINVDSALTSPSPSQHSNSTRNHLQEPTFPYEPPFSTKSAISSHLSASSNDLLTPFKTPSYEKLDALPSLPKPSKSSEPPAPNKPSTSLYDEYLNAGHSYQSTGGPTGPNQNNFHSQLVSHPKLVNGEEFLFLEHSERERENSPNRVR